MLHPQRESGHPTGGQAAVHGRNTALTLVTTFAIQGLGLLSGALVARLLGVQGRGLLAAVILWPTVVAYLGDLGGPLAYTYLAASKPNRLSTLVTNAFAITLAQTTALILVGIPIILVALHRYQNLILITVLFLIAYVPLNLLTRYLNAIQQGLGRFGRFNVARLSVQISYVVGVVLLFSFKVDQIAWVVAVVVLSNIVATLFVLSAVLPPLRPLVKIDRSLIRETFRYGIRAHIGNLTPIDSMQLDLMAVVAILGPRNAGLYAVAASAAMIVRAQGSALGMVALPGVAASKTIEEKRMAASGIFRLALLLHLLTAAAIVIAAGVAVPAIYGKEFAGAVPIVRVLTVGMVAASLRQVLGDCLRGFGRPLAGSVVEVVSWPVAIAGLVILIPLLATIGAALATSIAYFAALSVSVRFAQRSGLSWRDLFLPRRGDLALAIVLLRAPFAMAAAGSPSLRS